jgi:hypothetical protein
VCDFNSCDRPVYARGLCRRHYMQNREGKPLSPIGRYRRTHKDENGRVCVECKQYKPWSEFYDRTSGAKRQECKPCSIKAARQATLRREGRL